MRYQVTVFPNRCYGVLDTGTDEIVAAGMSEEQAQAWAGKLNNRQAGEHVAPTPGPWRFNEEPHGLFVSAGLLCIAHLGDGAHPEQQSNARLIAAAPDLYEWCRKHYEREEGPGQTDRPEYAELRAILAKVAQ